MSQGDGEEMEHIEGWVRKSKIRKLYKKWKVRRERRRAKKDPECAAKYGKYKGWEI